ncbi:MAG TPA: type VI secretion system baseplate subunit TssK [Gammaproteobacteria bacterium]|nr:type VI secretion system baseplate subunit TssK [Gammaproteobacteria bacterium]
MAEYGKVVWSEGLFLKPQHFQQQERYFENLIEQRCHGLAPADWGIVELEIDEAQLALGKFALSRLRGRLPDGTPVNIPADDEAPLPLDVNTEVSDTTVYLALPLKRGGTAEVDTAGDPASLSRYYPHEHEVRDYHADSDDTARMQLGRLRLRLLLEGEERGAYTCLPLARIVECRADRQVVLDQDHLPPLLNAHAAPKLAAFIKELAGMLGQRAEALAARVSGAGRGGSAEVADFMFLQAVNRYQPLLAYLADGAPIHPEACYRLCLQMAGELATFSENRRPGEFTPYRHDDLRATFSPLMVQLRGTLSRVLEQTAVPLPLEERRYGIRVAPLADHSLVGNAYFVLAVNAQLASEELRNRFPPQVKIGPVEKIRDLVNLQLPGIGLKPLPVAPRQIPYHAGFTYFELDRASEYWRQMTQSGGFAFHIGGDFPGLELEFWAIKG